MAVRSDAGLVVVAVVLHQVTRSDVTPVAVGQIWECLDKRRPGRARVVAVYGLGPEPFVAVENTVTGKRSLIALGRFRPHHNWRRVP